MKYFDAIAESAFKQNPDGEGWLYYPNGAFGKGRIVNDIETKKKLFKFHKNLYMFGLPIGALLGFSFVGDFTEVSNRFILGVFLLGIFLLQYLKVKNLAISNHKLKFKEAASVGLQGLPKWYHKLLYTFSGLAIVLGMSMPIIFNKSYNEIMPIILISLGIGVLAFVIAVMVQKLRA